MPDVMISHSTREKGIAEAICQRLEAVGLSCWIAPRNIPPGAEWTAAILEGIAASRLMVLVFSKNANESKHVSREVLYAGDSNIPVLPFRVEDVVPTGGLAYYLLGVQWLDAWQSPPELHLQALATRVQRLLSVGESAAPPMPARVTPAPVPPPREETLAPSPLTPAVLDAVANRLGLILGPIASHLVKNASTQVSTVPELCQQLAELIPAARDRETFLKFCRTQWEAAAPPPPAASVPPPPLVNEPARPPVTWPPATLNALKNGLADYLGPMAALVVDHAARQARTVDELHELLAAKIPSPKDREKWSKSLPHAKI